MTGLVFSIAVVSASVAGSQSVTSLFSSAAGLNNGVPDLTVTKINGPLNTSSKLKLWSGFCYDVRNAQYRKTVSSGFTSSVYVDGVLDREDIFDQSIPAGRWRTKCLARDFTLDCSVGSTKSYVVKICADSGAIISEANEDNNCLEKTFSCKSAYSAAELAPKSDLTVDKVWFTCMEGTNPDGSYSGQYTWDVKAQVSNLGVGYAKEITSLYWNNGKYEGRRFTDFFSPAGNKYFSTRDVWFFNIGAACGKNADGSWQTRTIKVCANPSLESLKADPTVSGRKSLLKLFGKALDSDNSNNCKEVINLSCNPKDCCMAGCTPPCCDPNKKL